MESYADQFSDTEYWSWSNNQSVSVSDRKVIKSHRKWMRNTHSPSTSCTKQEALRMSLVYKAASQSPLLHSALSSGWFLFLWNRLHFIKHCWEIKTLIKWFKCFVIYLSKSICHINIGHERWMLLLCFTKVSLTHCISLWNIQRAVYVFLLCNILQNYPYWLVRPYCNTANPQWHNIWPNYTKDHHNTPN